MIDAARATQWYDAWNARDAARIAALYAPDVEFTSPFVAALGFSPDGTIHGRASLQAYVEMALPRVPDLKFEPQTICAGCHGHTLIYRNQSGVLVAEAHEFDAAGLIAKASAAYEVRS